MIFGSLCSGIEAASCAWHPLGWRAAFFAEIEKFPSAVLAHHYPDVPNFGDITKFKDWPDATLDVLVGGTPCQSFSVAGLRKGLADPRGNLALVYLGIADRYRPEWLVWENVPGVLSSNGGRDFGAFLGGLAELGYGFAYRVLDAQFFGLAQRRKRVFVVANSRSWKRAAAVLFEPESLRGDPAPRREAGQGTAPTLAARTRGGGGLGTDAELDRALVPLNAVDGVSHALAASRGGSKALDATMETYVAAFGGGNQSGPIDVATAQTAHGGGARMDFESETFVAHALRAEGFDASEDGTGRGTPLVPLCFDETQITSAENRCNPQPGDPSHLLAKGARPPTICFSAKDHGADAMNDLSPTLRAGGHNASHANAGVMPAIAFHARQDPDSGPVTHPLDTDGSSIGVLQFGGDHASTQEGNSGALLRGVRDALGEKAFAEWGLGILDTLQSAQILQSALHGVELRPTAFSRRWVVDCALSRKEDRSNGAVQSLREAAGEGCAPQGWEPSQQRARELGAYLSQLSQPGAQAERFLQDLWVASEGLGLLRQALSAVQKARRPARSEGEPAYTPWRVRRLTPEEAEFLQGFPRGYTNITYRGKPAADGPRYKALGNSMAVPVMRWIGERIAAVDAMGKPEKQERVA